MKKKVVRAFILMMDLIIFLPIIIGGMMLFKMYYQVSHKKSDLLLKKVIILTYHQAPLGQEKFPFLKKRFKELNFTKNTDGSIEYIHESKKIIISKNELSNNYTEVGDYEEYKEYNSEDLEEYSKN